MQPSILERLQAVLVTLATPAAAAAGVTLALLILRHYALRWLERLARRKPTQLDEVLIPTLRTPTVLWCVAIGMMMGLEVAPLPRRLATLGTSIVAALIVLSVTIVVAKALDRWLQNLGQHIQLGTAVTGLGMTLTRILIFTLGGLLILSTLGISITPLLAALGVGALPSAWRSRIPCRISSPGSTFCWRNRFVWGLREAAVARGGVRNRHRVADHPDPDAAKQHGHCS